MQDSLNAIDGQSSHGFFDGPNSRDGQSSKGQNVLSNPSLWKKAVVIRGGNFYALI